ncbi:MAG: bacteriohemerythrin [Proteobacteria bacterium]|nr:bacteriohemerythrin [Pseudomonadota bacterium]MBU4296602.1 bacteriohemerythrin [Pseudomonadota bacterium]MCG2748231.1 bacteriohemerythrin [Desulfobulbaceae bacterium]
MGKIVWSKDYSVQSEYLDHQHQNLINILNDFNQAIARGEGKKSAYTILNRLVQYTEEHFRDEEKLMEIARFPAEQLHAHMKEHEKLTEEIFRHGENWSSYGKEALPEIGLFLKEWLMEHILTSDMKYSKYVANVDDTFLSVK